MGRGRQPVQARGGAMTWGKVDDKFHSHPKPENAGLLAVGLWTMALSYCCDLLTDGHVSRARVARLAIGHDGAALAEQLVASGLWHGADDPCDSPECNALRRAHDGWRFHDWTERQPLRADVEAKRAAECERKASGRARQGRATNGRVTSPAVPDGDVRAESERTPAGRGADSARNPSGLRQESGRSPTGPDPDPDPVPIPEQQQQQRAGAREGDPESDRARVLRYLRAHRSLRPIAEVRVAERVVEKRVGNPKPWPLIEQAIADLASKAADAEALGSPWSSDRMISALHGFIARAQPHEDTAPRSGPRPYAPPEPVRTGTRLLTFDDPPRPVRPPRPAPATDATVPGDALALVAGIGFGGRP